MWLYLEMLTSTLVKSDMNTFEGCLDALMVPRNMSKNTYIEFVEVLDMKPLFTGASWLHIGHLREPMQRQMMASIHPLTFDYNCKGLDPLEASPKPGSMIKVSSEPFCKASRRLSARLSPLFPHVYPVRAKQPFFRPFRSLQSSSQMWVEAIEMSPSQALKQLMSSCRLLMISQPFRPVLRLKNHPGLWSGFFI